MHIYNTYKHIRDQWWALPLVLPCVLLPTARSISTFTHLDGGLISLYYMPLPFLLSLMLFYGFKALPGIVLSIGLIISWGMNAWEVVGVVLHFLIPIIVSWGGYRVFVPRRHQLSYGDPRLVAHRLLWQVFIPATLFQVLLQCAVFLGVFPKGASMSAINPMTLLSLINYQAMLVGCLTGVPLCYVIIRVIRHPFYLRAWWSQLKMQFEPRVKWPEITCWGLILCLLFALLLTPVNNSSSIFSTNYTLSLVLPIMLWGSMRFGYRFMSIIWTPLLIISIHYYYRYMPIYPGYRVQLAITSSSYLIFSFIVVYMAMLSTRQRRIYTRVRRMAFLDPVMHMPNIRALKRSLDASPWSVVCFLRIPELEVLGRHYGMILRIQYKQNITQWLSRFLQTDESVYHLSGHDLVIRLNTNTWQERIVQLDVLVKAFRFNWDGVPLQPKVGISYCYVRSPVTHLPLLLGELSTIADWSLVTSHPESLQRKSAEDLQLRLKEKIVMMNNLQQALEHNRFCLLVQPITGIRGDNFHEVLLRMVGDDGERILPERFLPVAQEFGLSARIDMWVLENTLRFMNQHREVLPGIRLSINLSSASVCSSQFPDVVELALKQNNIQGWQLIFEISEHSSLTYPVQAQHTLESLQLLGCRIAIDEFGTGYGSYTKLKEVKADLLKVDGSFIRNLLNSSLDYQIVESICHLARVKKMQVVAEHIENEETRSAVVALGVDYLQGFYLGKPHPLEELLTRKTLPAESGSDVW